MTSKTIKVDYLTRVEGEGSLFLRIDKDKVTEARLNIFEPPRFFEAFLRGRSASEAPDITSRICGICPVAYQMSAIHAMERAARIRIEGPLRDLRRLLYCGEWIESHALHIFMLHAPDFLGFDDAIAMAREHPDIVQTGLSIKKAGNSIVECLGGREVHPINIRLGGFYRVPQISELEALRDTLKRARDDMERVIDWISKLPFPDVSRDYEFVSLRHPDEYPMNEGQIVSNKGLEIDVSAFDDTFEEEHVPHSTALHAIIKGRGAYFVGPMARFNLNFAQLSPLASEAAKRTGLSEGCTNPFKSILVRAIEVLFAFEEALRIISIYERPEAAHVEIDPADATGWAATEAPRGLLYHHYKIDPQGRIETARIIPPTSQNQKIIEDDLKTVAQHFIGLSDDELKWRCEQTIRNYDPCISCAAHFLTLNIDRASEGL